MLSLHITLYQALTLGTVCFKFLCVADLTHRFSTVQGFSRFYVACWVDKSWQEAGLVQAQVASNTPRYGYYFIKNQMIDYISIAWQVQKQCHRGLWECHKLLELWATAQSQEQLSCKGGHSNTSVVHLCDQRFSKHTLITISPLREKHPQMSILHDFAPKSSPKQAFLEDMFGGVRKMTPKCP